MFVPDCRVLLCDFHREKAWVEWVRRKENGCGEDTLALLREIANSSTEEDFQLHLAQLRESAAWEENGKLRHWFTRTWLPEVQVSISVCPIHVSIIVSPKEVICRFSKFLSRVCSDTCVYIYK